ncbi:AbrB/MazE/SpoVT family DNA-binding domain-containing protein [Paenibacillus wulumuqiensis]|uniref:AbrB/MazE/SpoVT family DNA-binding domain-containing protein n=1 Tax=Paenibacillus wulumuqiensis TaxID=1567107 RepID=UPI000619DF76|nr:AbrB/MazE/SpoVT family DNA-binding domain-containing protein [Paenibacillus wulumuqiensis]
MKKTGMVRQLDSLGRIVIPKEIRDTMEIGISDPMEFFITEKEIIFRKHKGIQCIFCGSFDDLVYYKDQFICGGCAGQMGDESMHTPLDEMTEPPASQRNLHSSLRKSRNKRGEMMNKVEAAMQENPGATQNELARILGISQSRVCQIQKELRAGHHQEH